MNRLTDEQLDNLTNDALESLTDDQIEEYRESFALFEDEETGTIPAKELGTLMYSFGQCPTDVELKRLTDKYDSSDKQHKGGINFSDFATIMVQNKMKEPKAEGKEVDLHGSFKIFDKDGNGQLSKDELV